LKKSTKKTGSVSTVTAQQVVPVTAGCVQVKGNTAVVNSQKKQGKSSRRLIDIMQKAFEKAGYKTERDGWHNDIKRKDPDNWHEWLDIVGPVEEDGRQTSVHFYFENDATNLTEISVFRDNWRLTDSGTGDKKYSLKKE
jgi:hypothetical protein